MRPLLASPNPPDGVFAADDYCTLGAMQKVRRRTLRVPEDAANVGFSNESFTLISEPSITTIDPRCEEMARQRYACCWK